MMARRGVLGMLSGGAAALLSGCGLFGGNSYRFRMTVEVDTPQGLKTGSSVYAVTGFTTSDLMTGGTSSDTEFKGEAAMVDLGDGRVLFALLRMANGTSSDDHLAIMSMKAMDPAYANNKKDSAQRIAAGSAITSPAEVAPKDYPLLVTFGDMQDPTSVTRVDPANLAASFGPGVRLKRIMVEVTDDDVTMGIEERLGWLFNPNRKRISPDKKPEGIPLGNFDGLFSTRR
ncbi:MAG: hypothetical protein EDM03_15295 [Porphyrobacter sp. IPPAS B-1204]|nr:MAG: hypothetical protein EDM03_15295 [Porphyrobacter sp. IPPAS B-1204]